MRKQAETDYEVCKHSLIQRLIIIHLWISNLQSSTSWLQIYGSMSAPFCFKETDILSVEVLIFTTMCYSPDLCTRILHKNVEQFCFLNNNNLNCDSTLKINQVWNETSTSNNSVHTASHCVESSLQNKIITSGTATRSLY